MDRTDYGDGQRLSFQENELANAPIVPNPVEYEDIDNAFCNYFKDNLTIVDEEGKKFNIYTFFSSQRFSEFSQTWGHDDADGNLLMNFFTILRSLNCIKSLYAILFLVLEISILSLIFASIRLFFST